MAYASLSECVKDLEKSGALVRIAAEVDPALDMGMIQRRVHARGGPALLFERPKGSRFPMLANLFGTKARAEYLFRDSLAGVRALVDARVDVARLLKSPAQATRLPFAAAHALPRSVKTGPVLAHVARISDLPRLVSWPRDGGPFITLPQVFTEDPDQPGLMASNLGMYRVQLAGNDYVADREIGLHYQIHRGIGVHHAAAVKRGARLPVSIFVGGPPAMTLAAVMPLPEGLPEIAFAGALGGRAIRMIRPGAGETHVHADADFVIQGHVEPSATKPEGPFGDHLGYYSERHLFPVMTVTSVHHREGAIWPFTTVGRPPQEDTVFGELIHALTAPLVPQVLPGVRGVHAVDAAGVHPLLLAVGSERYVPYAANDETGSARAPMELLTQANAILGQGQMSLAKYLFIAADERSEGSNDGPLALLHDLRAFFMHVLERIVPARDLHFQVRTTIDTLDYSGEGLNRGSKVIIAACGPKRRELHGRLPRDLHLPDGCHSPRIAFPGAMVVGAPPAGQESWKGLRAFCEIVRGDFSGTPLIVLVDDPGMTARTIENFVWVTFTRSNPSIDLDGVGAFVEHKGWGCRGPIVIDARRKPHHAPPLEEDPEAIRRVEALASKGSPLHGIY